MMQIKPHKAGSKLPDGWEWLPGVKGWVRQLPPPEQLAKGADGKDGAQGPQGLPGEQGEQGPVGPRGPRGLKGDTGAQGEPGPAGVDGKDGKQGKPGKDGKDGADGVGVSAIVSHGPDLEITLSDGKKTRHRIASSSGTPFGGGGGGASATTFNADILQGVLVDESYMIQGIL